MSTYGRNFWFLVPPQGNQRASRYAVPTTGDELPIGAPVEANNAVAETALGLRPVALVDGAVDPVSGKHGIAVYEYGPAAYAGDDPFLTTYSDKGTIPLGAAVQVVSGKTVKVCFKNTEATTFLQTRSYTGKNMVAEGGATPAIAVGDYLTPKDTPGDSAGYWKKTTDVTEAWLIVTKVDSSRQEVEARMLF